MTALYTKLQMNGFLDPTILSVLEHFTPVIRKSTSIDTLSWLDLIAFLAFQQGHTSLSLVPEDLFQLVSFFFREAINPATSAYAFSQEEIAYICECLMKEIEHGSWKRWGEDNIIFSCENKHLLILPFSKHFDFRLARELYRLASVTPIPSSKPKNSDDVSYLTSSLSQKLLEKLNDEQKEAIRASFFSPVSLIYGGPGTGKTHTAGALIALLTHRFYSGRLQEHVQSSLGAQPYRVLTTAPTGKAVFTLKASIQNYFKRVHEVLGLPFKALELESMTIHAFFMEQRRTGKDTGYHAIIVDESSMIDSQLMAELLSEIHSGTRVILMGDPNQLPPIQPGKPFADMIHASHLVHGGAISFPASPLKKCMRAELQGIVSLAEAALQGNMDEFFFQFEKKGQVETKFISFEGGKEDAQRVFDTLYENVAETWEKSSHISIDEAIALSVQAKILSPVRKSGRMNVQSINKAISQTLYQRSSSFSSTRTLKPILITKNMYSLQCMNGDIGILESTRDHLSKPWKNHIHIPESPVSPFSQTLCPDFELAYAMSIHKSQGSEFQKVITLIPDTPFSLSRELLYTAITRARREIMLIGKRSSIQEALLKKTERMSCLPYLIQKTFSSGMKK